jgi:hypothetical protein
LYCKPPLVAAEPGVEEEEEAIVPGLLLLPLLLLLLALLHGVVDLEREELKVGILVLVPARGVETLLRAM